MFRVIYVLYATYLDDAGDCAWLGVMYMPPVTGTG